MPAPGGSDFDQPFGSQEDDDEEISFSAFDVDSFDDRTFDEPADSADEQQGPYQTLQPGSRLDWAVEWRLEELPSGTPLVAGSTELIQAVADTQR